MLSKFVPRFGSSMTATVTISGFVAVLFVTLALAGASWMVLVDYVADGAARRQDANIRAAATILERDHPGTRIEWNADGRPRIVMGDIPAAISDHSTIDAVSRVTGDTTTLFGFDEATGEFVRRTTNVKKADGSRAVGTVLGKNGKVHPIVSRGETFTGTVDILGIPYVTTYTPVFSPAGKVIGIVYSGVKKSVVDAVIGSWTRSIAITGGLVLFLASSALFFFGRRITRPLVDLAGALDRVSRGDLGTEMPHRDRGDEVGAVARAAETLRRAAGEREALAATQNREHGERAAEQRRIAAAIAAFRSSIAGTLKALDADVGTMSATATDLTRLADEATGRAESAARATGEASSGAASVAAAVDELAGSVTEIDRRATAATGAVETARRAAEESNARIASLAEASGRIGAVLDLIRDIAEQTNLLALNATIEAARAGEAGRGFAVVASEVKTLAGQTAKATDEIAEQIGSIRTEVEGAVSAISAIVGRIGEASSYTEAIAAAVNLQTTATGDISHAARSAAEGASRAAEDVSGVNTVAERTDRAAERVAALAADLTNRSKGLGAEVERFLGAVAA
ncbi:methyl-accepting chemotaxis protein [Pinisolibacter sp.]|uniref:methyl-accepting chemotaxis protein n=1 Tax=Pinisolibacter sp. TaxID=2172024 RepID=UPI002FDCD81F